MIESLLVLFTYCPNVKSLSLDAEIPLGELELFLIISEELFSKIGHIKIEFKLLKDAKRELEYEK